MFGDGDVIEVHEPSARYVHRAVLALAPDVKEDEVGVMEVLVEPDGVDKHLVSLGVGWARRA
jgi:hypothetical protein